jgi:hypothetical protein
MKRCTRCERPCLPRSWNRDQLPTGHVPYRARGLCDSCYKIIWSQTHGKRCERQACPGCGVTRIVKPSRPSSGLCKQCYYTSLREPLTYTWPEHEVELTGGRWVTKPGGIKVWREDGVA